MLLEAKGRSSLLQWAAQCIGVSFKQAKLESEGCSTRSEASCRAMLAILGKMSARNLLQKLLFRVFLSNFSWRKTKIAWPGASFPWHFFLEAEGACWRHSGVLLLLIAVSPILFITRMMSPVKAPSINP